MTWSGDVAKMVSRLVCNPAAMREMYSIATAEHHTWAEVAGYYGELIGLKYEAVDLETYLGFFGGTDAARYQLVYDRCARRVMDNSKILTLTGLHQADFMPLLEGLRREIAAIPAGKVWPESPVNSAMDEWLAARG